MENAVEVHQVLQRKGFLRYCNVIKEKNKKCVGKRPKNYDFPLKVMILLWNANFGRLWSVLWKRKLIYDFWEKKKRWAVAGLRREGNLTQI